MGRGWALVKNDHLEGRFFSIWETILGLKQKNTAEFFITIFFSKPGSLDAEKYVIRVFYGF